MARLWAEVDDLVVLGKTLRQPGGIPIDLDSHLVAEQERLGLVERRTY